MATIHHQPVYDEAIREYEVGSKQSMQYLDEYPFLSGGAGLLSTLNDYMMFAKMLLNGGTLNGVQVISRKTIDFMTRNQLPQQQDILSMLHNRSFMKPFFTENDGFGLGSA
eukprot:TRINITY_DN30301_c0_g1_i1.p1 TRINITY_DN30301_c0_g1~~TRINITY_DN30301_c0_g1_i1.p1  ORF type:complete len:111 (-),score=5.63 TRINITY_DN30301_c0_g1_i1:191-523(-)